MDIADKLSYLITAQATAMAHACGWVQTEDSVTSWSEVAYWSEYETWEECHEGTETTDGGVVVDCATCDEGDSVYGVECDCQLKTYCTRRGLFGGCTQEYSFYDCQYVVKIDYSSTTNGTTTVADAFSFVGSLREGYRQVMSYNDAGKMFPEHG